MKGLVGVDVVDDVDCAPGPPHGFGNGSRFSVPRWGFSGVEPDSASIMKNDNRNNPNNIISLIEYFLWRKQLNRYESDLLL